MIQRIAGIIIGLAGIIAAVIQSFFGVFSYVAARIDSTTGGYLRTENDRITSDGSLNSLLSFGGHAFIAGILCSVISALALYLFLKKGQRILPGLLFLLAGCSNCLILFGAGLPVGIIIVIAGIVVITGKPSPLNHGPLIQNNKQMSD
ncbi:hypothetical protein [Sporolactobacillus laevolacticus]|uniref:hypothetical protein n=1 Tax=Sporolactobacillus laevolacticus TaxID=33018 RepID=UPI0025B4397D|nr:hypothetical protein [Sporolactobacillus laevolacticus]MDN3956855.1 hypothetical protein [Sporolactobacillus laevolacticus]